LEENGFTAKDKKPIKHMVKCAERSGAALEIIPTNQWFVKVLEHKEALKKKAQECNWNPDFMYKRIEQWIDSLSWDWCISRQRYFGVPFPVWYSKREGEEGKIILPKLDQLPVNPITDLPEGYSKDEVTPDFDVMDTWATSSISPQISSKGINLAPNVTPHLLRGKSENFDQPRNECGVTNVDEKLIYALNTARHKQLFPADLRPQAHEIIRTWAFYTIVKAYLHEDKIPWKNLMISGWCLAEDKSKMSKSKGNIVTPQSILQENSADAIRYWASTSRLGADTAFSKDVLKIGKKLVNKLWNASKFASIHFGLLDKNILKNLPAKKAVEQNIIFEPLDKWIISKLRKTIIKATEELELYEYSLARLAIEDFFWKDFCDNYLEAVKARTYNEEGQNQKSRMSAIYSIYFCLDAVLRLFAPFVPHITDELYSHIYSHKLEGKPANLQSIHAVGNWVEVDEFIADNEAEKIGEIFIESLEQIRKIKAEANVSIKKPTITTISASDEIINQLKSIEKDFANVTSSTEIIYKQSLNEIKIELEFIAEEEK
ncbi:MAG: class I tRNA ligase family protein, partial [Rickettsiales bacterium]|nr:class I tRNA ligase family protein [Rickettsiales bacterium]